MVSIGRLKQLLLKEIIRGKTARYYQNVTEIEQKNFSNTPQHEDFQWIIASKLIMLHVSSNV